MAFLHPQSREGVKSELDLFAVPPTQRSIDEAQWIEHQPITSIEFVVPGAGDAYIDLANTYLFVRAKVIRGAGTNLADDTPVEPVNNWLHSLFSQVDVYLNDTQVTSSSNTYPFRAYVETLLSYGAKAKKTIADTVLYLQINCRYLQLNCGYLQIDLFEDIYNSFGDIYNSFGDISKYVLFGDISN